jgi:hypothetical protein
MCEWPDPLSNTIHAISVTTFFLYVFYCSLVHQYLTSKQFMHSVFIPFLYAFYCCLRLSSEEINLSKCCYEDIHGTFHTFIRNFVEHRKKISAFPMQLFGYFFILRLKGIM